MIDKHAARDYLKAEGRKDLRTARAVLTNRPLNGYLGWDGYGNLGDEAVWEAYLQLFPQLHLQSFRVGTPVQKLAKLLGRPIPIRSAALGGGTLINQAHYRLEQVELLLAKGVPMYALGTGVASKSFWQNHTGVHSGDDMERWVAALRQFAYVGVRGPRSQKLLADAGLQVDIVGDSALALAKDDYRHRTSRKIVGLNVSGGTLGGMWGNAETFLTEMGKCVRQLLADGFEVRLLPIWAQDLPACQKIAAAVNSPNYKLVKAYSNVPAYIAAVEQCDLFIGLKLHATIIATMLRIPAIMLEYRPKCLDYMESVGMGNYSFRTDQINALQLAKKVHEQVAHYNEIVHTLDTKILYYKQLQQEKAALIQAKLAARA